MLKKAVLKRSFAFFSTKDYNPEFVERIASQNVIKNDQKNFRFAIVGSGPAGFYMTKMLLGFVPKCRVDIFDRNPHPYGLIRNGVAPDHQAMKKIQNDFKQVFDQNSDRCTFFGNVWVGGIDKNQKDYDMAKNHEESGFLSVDTLRENYSAVVIAHGASKDRLLGFDNELSTKGVLPSRRVVNWYNGSLDNDLDLKTEFNLENAQNMTIIGNGNIFCDIARILLKDPATLQKFDLHTDVLSFLAKSKLTNIQSVARRGITHSAFTTKEIRELASLPDLELYMMKSEVQRSMTDASQNEMASDYGRAIGRRTEFLLKNFRAIQDEDHYKEILENGKKKLILRYLLSPAEILADDGGQVTGMLFDQMKLEGPMLEQKASIDSSLPRVRIDSEIVVKSIGYQSTPIIGLPFDFKKHILPHEHGCVVDPENGNQPIPGVYVAGWAKRGPVGIIDATLRDTKQTFGVLKHHLETDQLEPRDHTVSDIEQLLPKNFVRYSNWLRIDKYETDIGQQMQKVREKVLDREEMIKIANNK